MADSLERVISRGFSVWQKVVALAPLLLVAVYLPGQMMLRCRIDGLLRPACCCPAQDENQDSGPVVKAQACCDREISTRERPVVEAARRSSFDAPWASVTALPVSTGVFDLAEADRPARTWQTQGPPRDGPPLVLLKHAFLI